MAPKAMNARNRIDRTHRFRGHGPRLQRHCQRLVCLAHAPSQTVAPPQYDFGSPSTFSAM